MLTQMNWDTKWLGKPYFHKEITDSTSLDIKRLAEENSPEGTMVSADLQTMGRGRRGRSWLSSAGENLLFSILLRPATEPDKAPRLTLLMALAVTGVLQKNYELDAKIKWPNDVIVNGKKVCGILTEMYLDGNAIRSVVVGTGINVNQSLIPEELEACATSMLLEKGQKFAREEVLNRVLAEFESLYEEFLQTGNLKNVLSRYNEWLISRDTEVRVLDPKGEYFGIARGINEEGELLVELPNGQINAVYAGEVSVRGVYGYV